MSVIHISPFEHHEIACPSDLNFFSFYDFLDRSSQCHLYIEEQLVCRNIGLATLHTSIVQATFDIFCRNRPSLIQVDDRGVVYFKKNKNSVLISGRENSEEPTTVINAEDLSEEFGIMASAISKASERHKELYRAFVFANPGTVFWSLMTV